MQAWRAAERRISANDDGQATSEYIGVLAIVALVVSLVVAVNPAGVIRDGTQTNVERVLSGTGTEPGVPPDTTTQAPPYLVMSSASSGGGSGGGNWRRVIRDVCVVLVLACSNQTDKTPLNDMNVPKPPVVQQKENKDKREEETTVRQPAAEPSSGATATPQPMTTYQPQQAPPIGAQPDEDNGALTWLAEAADAVGAGIVVVVGGVLTVLGWFVPRPGMA